MSMLMSTFSNSNFRDKILIIMSTHVSTISIMLSGVHHKIVCNKLYKVCSTPHTTVKIVFKVLDLPQRPKIT